MPKRTRSRRVGNYGVGGTKLEWGRSSTNPSESVDDDHDWSGLPVELLGEILMRSCLVEEFIVFSSVCRSWSRAANIARKEWHRRSCQIQMPWVITVKSMLDAAVTLYKPNKNVSFTMSCLGTTKCTYFGSSYGLIAMITEHQEVYLYNPLTRIRLSLPNLQSTLPNYYMYLTRLFVLKMPEDQFLVVVLVKHEHLSFARPGNEAWIPVQSRNNGVTVADVTYWNGLLLIMYVDGSVAYCDINNEERPLKTADYLPCPKQLEAYISPPKLYMTESSGNLLIISRHIGCGELINHRSGYFTTREFKVYMLDQHTKKEWKETNSLGDASLFVGETCTVSVSSASEANNCKPNCIYFTDTISWTWKGKTEYIMGLYHMKDNTIQPFYQLDCDTSPRMLDPSWFMPAVYC